MHEQFNIFRSIALFDTELQYLHVSPEREPPFPSVADLVGTHPWDHGGFPEQHTLLREIPMRIPNRGDFVEIELRWRYKSVDYDVFQFSTIHRASTSQVEFAADTWIFPPEFGDLTGTERTVIDVLGTGVGINRTAEILGKAATTVRSHCNSVRQKLSLDSLDQLFVFAAHYSAASNSKSADHK
jgi:DNA-binding CsgD family transcriptional regulator